jgi:hypothetical protein
MSYTSINLIIFYLLILLGCLLSAVFVNRVMKVNGEQPGYKRSLAVVIGGILFVGVFNGILVGPLDGALKLVFTLSSILILGQIYRMLLRTNGQMVSYGKSVLVAFGSSFFIGGLAFLISILLVQFGVLQKVV